MLTDDQRQFIDDLAALLMVWTMPHNVARLYGYLQIASEPVSLDEIARDLEISKSNAFGAAKLLEQHGNARRIGERGTKRVLLVASDDPGAPLRRQSDALGRMAALIGEREDAVADGSARERLSRLGRFHAQLRDAMERVIRPGG
ncbi:MAG: hypothetical protein ABW184_04730 [Sphingobium sp.]